LFREDIRGSGFWLTRVEKRRIMKGNGIHRKRSDDIRFPLGIEVDKGGMVMRITANPSSSCRTSGVNIEGLLDATLLEPGCHAAKQASVSYLALQARDQKILVLWTTRLNGHELLKVPIKARKNVTAALFGNIVVFLETPGPILTQSSLYIAGSISS
jgi:hypothetical protein